MKQCRGERAGRTSLPWTWQETEEKLFVVRQVYIHPVQDLRGDARQVAEQGRRPRCEGHVFYREARGNALGAPVRGVFFRSRDR